MRKLRVDNLINLVKRASVMGLVKLETRQRDFDQGLANKCAAMPMRWDSPNAEGIMALAAMDQSRQWQACWNLQDSIAA
jgi:hypothetical protein